MPVAVVLMAGCSGTHTEYADLSGAEVPALTGRTLVLTGTHGACDSVLPPEVSESAEEVRVRVPLRVQNGACPAVALSLRVEVQLDKPLGNRTVTDTEDKQPLPVR